MTEDDVIPKQFASYMRAQLAQPQIEDWVDALVQLNCAYTTSPFCMELTSRKITYIISIWNKQSFP